MNRIVIHLAYHHNRNDGRIVMKECISLIKKGFEVYYVTYSNIGKHIEGVNYIQLRNRNNSPFVNYIADGAFTSEILAIIEEVNPCVVHIHEYGLNYLIGRIKKKNPQIRIIYDVHEDNAGMDYENDIHKYGFIGAKILRKLRFVMEKRACSQSDWVIAATPKIQEILSPYSHNISVVRNYPIVGKNDKSPDFYRKVVCYAGTLTDPRGVRLLISMSNDIDGRVEIAGLGKDGYMDGLISEYSDTYEKKWTYKGMLEKKELFEFYADSSVGAFLPEPTQNMYDAIPVKLFEYMEAGLPVVVSDFPYMKNIVEGEKCGLCVKFDDINGICSAINQLLDNPNQAKEMGMNGRKAVLEKYNWDIEKEELLNVYRRLLWRLDEVHEAV